MSLWDIPLQSSFLYNEKWSEEKDGVFIDTLLEQQRGGHWNPIHGNFHALLTAHGVLNDLYSARLNWDDVLERSNELRKHYETFKYILEQDKVWWDRPYNKVRAERSTWKFIVKHHLFVKAYFYEGEPQYDNLEVLFKPEIARPTGTEVIVISDGNVPDEELPNAKGAAIELSDDEDEVASPAYVENQRAHKNVWPERDMPKFTMFDVNEDKSFGSWSSPMDNVNKFTVAPKFKKGGPLNAGESSSCASSSPVKWFHFSGKKK